MWVAGSHLGWLKVSRNSPSCKCVWYRIRTWIQARCSEIPTFSNFGHHILEIVDFLSVQPVQKEPQKLPNTLFLLTGRKILKIMLILTRQMPHKDFSLTDPNICLLSSVMYGQSATVKRDHFNVGLSQAFLK